MQIRRPVRPLNTIQFHKESNSRCKYSHDLTQYPFEGDLDHFTETGLPLRPGITQHVSYRLKLLELGQRLCGVFSKTGNCPYGPRCKYDHFRSFVHGPRTPLESLQGRPNHTFNRFGSRRPAFNQDTNRFPINRYYQDSGAFPHLNSSSTPVPFSNETSPRSTTDLTGTLLQTSTPMDTRNQHLLFLEPHHQSDRQEKESEEKKETQSRLSYLLEVLDQKREVYREYNSIIGLSWPSIGSQWYPPGAPNGSMKSRLDKDLNFESIGAPTLASHLLKPFRTKDNSIIQVKKLILHTLGVCVFPGVSGRL